MAAILSKLNDQAALARLFDLPPPDSGFPHQHQAVTAVLGQHKTAAHTSATPATAPLQTLITAEESTNCQSTPEGIKAQVSIAFRAPDVSGSRASEVGDQNHLSIEALAPERLTPLESAFVDALLRSPTLDVPAAYLSAAKYAGKKAKDAVSAGRALYQRDKVQGELARRRRFIEVAVDAQAVQLERMFARVALADLRQLYDANGALLPPSQWPDDIAMAVGGIEEEEKRTIRGRGEDKTDETTIQRKVKLKDGLAAARTLLQRRGLVQHEAPGGGFIAHFDINIGGGK